MYICVKLPPRDLNNFLTEKEKLRDIFAHGPLINLATFFFFFFLIRKFCAWYLIQ